MSDKSSRKIEKSSDEHRTVETRASVRNGVARMIVVVISIVLEIILFVLAFVGLHQYAGWILILTRIAATMP